MPLEPDTMLASNIDRPPPLASLLSGLSLELQRLSMAAARQSDRGVVQGATEAHGVVLATLAPEVEWLDSTAVLLNGHRLHGRKHLCVDGAADPRAVEPRRLHARENDREALGDERAEARGAIRLPQRQEGAQACHFAALLNPVALHRADQVHVAGRDDLDAALLAQFAHPGDVRVLVRRGVPGDDDMHELQPERGGLRLHQLNRMRPKCRILGSEDDEGGHIQ
mmetsp:Transcript_118677/g.378341  ORF Transcript_118677/g.378341 Transcript_118677/m.378341 type:complete len:224 (-) Transcript_118677:246-917(-)